MDRALVVVDDSEVDRRLVAEAAAYARGNDVHLEFLTLLDASEFDRDADVIATIGHAEHTSYDEDVILDSARDFVENLIGEELDSPPENYTADAAIVEDDDDRADYVLNEAAERDCSHIFLAGRKRSPAGKALFGDVVQRVILNFDGPVTVITA
jgi:nucleotide-binding universal stress UspA family protein